VANELAHEVPKDFKGMFGMVISCVCLSWPSRISAGTLAIVITWKI